MSEHRESAEEAAEKVANEVYKQTPGFPSNKEWPALCAAEGFRKGVEWSRSNEKCMKCEDLEPKLFAALARVGELEAALVFIKSVVGTSTQSWHVANKVLQGKGDDK